MPGGSASNPDQSYRTPTRETTDPVDLAFHEYLNSAQQLRDQNNLFSRIHSQIVEWVKVAIAKYRIPSSMAADFVQSAELQVLESLPKITTKRIQNIGGYLRVIINRSVYRQAKAQEHHGITGLSGADRRNARIAKTRDALKIEIGREPTDQEVIAAANDLVLHALKNPVKQGATISRKDKAGVVVDPPRNDENEVFDDVWGTADMTDQAEANISIEMCIEACRIRDVFLGQIARLWIGDLFADPPVVRTATDIADTLHIPKRLAVESLQRCRQITRELME